MGARRSLISAKRFLWQRILLSFIGIIVNVTLALSMNKLGFHLFLDTVGTIAISSMGGLFPGILTAVVTNSICALFNVNYIYYGFVNAIVAIMTAWFVRKYGFKKLWKVLLFILALAAFSGSVSAWINWLESRLSEAAE